ncbi:MAG: hypothetical protein ABIJ09_17040 [Pseudomonadota bacterium]
MHRPPIAILVVLSGALQVTTLRAQTPITRIVVLPVVVSAGVDPAKGPLLDDMLLTALTRRTPAQIQVVGSKDVVSVLGHEEQKQLLGCSDQSCLAEIGSALGASHILSATVGRIGEKIVVSGTLLDVSNATAVHRETLYLGETEEELIEAMTTLSDKMAASPGWRAGVTSSGTVDPQSSPLLWGGVALAGVGLLTATGLGAATAVINGNLDQRSADYKSQSLLGLGTLAGASMGGVALLAGMALVAVPLLMTE